MPRYGKRGPRATNLQAITEDAVEVQSLPSEGFAAGDIGDGEDSWETGSVSSKFGDLFEAYSGRRVPLGVLDNELRELHEQSGISWNKFRLVIKSRGICLTNCQEYGSPWALAEQLRMNEKLIMSKQRAKAYRHVKACMIQVYF
ncbi:unnamed protein product [Polarella glacialis]|uniref:Uncharacterized protein n=1 Tax=Polarella glacialis TaxID=89957 RepID=A0A813I148_POLGL|nr:unnamed protein product [Polarella glacialis]CAE8719584.1 unnamed protein product [Polarella glacialis]|eukprot:CAMPEP_0115079056 /NCGR_PEP_ID=MMETSP0227-20121206/17888_1 /TAXON_ID=89957 /ORGANISM="Polarella glacialis, Strain CCMP 1383" /LENGTH=143 /DNA_ID=CAMNT_0002466501 /DNA_START=84 /DNA_END=515 /DNA_ORIENTATION=+